MQLRAFSEEDFSGMDRFFRMNLINQLSGPRSAFLVGTADRSGSTNLALFNSVVHVGANPPLLGLVFRPHTVPRHTLENIRETGVFTLNQVHVDMIEAAHTCSANYSREMSEFDASGLIAEYRKDFPAPFVAESFVKMAMVPEEEHLIAANQTIFMVAKIVDLWVAEDAVEAGGHLDEKITRPAAVMGLDTYLSTEQIMRLGYARP